MRPPRTLGKSLSVERLQYVVEQYSKVLSNISFGTTASNTDGDINIQCYKATGTTPGSANTEFAVPHNLAHVPFGFIVVSTGAAAHIYKSTTAWTSATTSSLGNIYLKCDQASVAFSIIIV